MDRCVRRPAPEQREVNTVFQSYALFPHMTVFDNVAFGLRMRNQPPDKIHARVSEALQLVQLAGFEGRRPHPLSGGQQQRVAVAWAAEKKLYVYCWSEYIPGAVIAQFTTETGN